jgi:hypothetical protein
MWSHGANDSNMPWYLLVSVPQTAQASITAPTITGAGFTITSTSSAFFTPSSPGSIYDLFSQTNTLGGNSSMNASNMFGPLEQTAFGGTTPHDFDVLLYTVTPGFNGNTAYAFNVATPGLINGTFLAAIGVGGTGNNIQFSTPFTDTGLVDAGGPPPPPPPPPPPVPEPGSVVLMGTLLSFSAAALKRKRR